MAGGTTIGIWIGEDDDLVEEFDAAFGSPPDYSRSDEIKNAMRLRIAVEDAFDAVDYEFDSEPDKRMWIRQAILDKARNDAGPG